MAVVRPDGSLNLADLAKSQAPAEPEPAEPEPAEVPRLFIGTFSVNTGRIDFEDHSRSSEFQSSLKPITFVLRDFNTTGTGTNFYMLDAESTLGEKLYWRGTLNANPVSSEGTFTLTNVQAQTVWDYIREHDVPVHPLYERGFTSIGCAPCTRAIAPGEPARAGRWWWETNAPKECGMHCAIETGGFEHELHAILGDEAHE